MIGDGMRLLCDKINIIECFQLALVEALEYNLETH